MPQTRFSAIRSRPLIFSILLPLINQQKHYPYMDGHYRSGLLEQRIETTFQVVSILIGWAAIVFLTLAFLCRRRPKTIMTDHAMTEATSI
jgi:hypothetical protein